MSMSNRGITAAGEGQINNATLDVVIIGAGLSGIGAAVHLKTQCPGQRFAILEARDAIGGTWDLFRYPGVRSDSDMYTLGYAFKPWTNAKAIADGADIRHYIEDTAQEYQLLDSIRFQHRVTALDWSSRNARWTLTVHNTATDETLTLYSRFVIGCTGYYNYAQGFTPEFAGQDTFKGQIVHPQHWPKALDYANKRVVVIGSGATAVTLVPSLADRAAKVTMLQRSPTYIAAVPGKSPIAHAMRRVLPEKAAYRATRAANILLAQGFYKASRRWPKRMRNMLLGQVQKAVGDKVDMRHFTPHYDVWDQRLCAVPDGDLFKALRHKKADVVTDIIESFTAEGIRLASGQTLTADIIVTATGLDVQLLGDARLTLDGQAIKVNEKRYYKGAMLEDVPNFAMIFGYTNSSWTLKADLIADYVCRLINYMNHKGYAQFAARDSSGIKSTVPFLDFPAGYVLRAQDKLPRQGDKSPWKLYQSYFRDYLMFKWRRVNDKGLVFTNPIAYGYAGAPAANETSDNEVDRVTGKVVSLSRGQP